MGTETGVPFTHHTWNPWRGCTHALLHDGTPHPGCDGCYAERMAKRNPRTLGVWGDEGTRPVGTEEYWNLPYKWAKGAKANGERERVFMSLADPFEDRDELIPHRTRQFQTIDETADWLDYLLFTKRPQNVPKFWPSLSLGYYRSNVWLVYSVSDQQSLDSWGETFMACRQLVPVLGFSFEPLLGPVSIPRTWLGRGSDCPDCGWMVSVDEDGCCIHCGQDAMWYGANWALVGGKSGPGFEDMTLDHLRSIVEQCQAADVPVWIKQDSGYVPDRQGRIPDELWQIKQLPKVVI